MTKRPPPHLVAILGVALLVGSCIGTDSPTGVGDGEARVNIPIQPALIPSPADAGAAPVNRIRARVERITNGQLLGETMVDVDPDAAEWEVILTAQLSGTLPVEARLYVFLINASGTTENVQFSGRAGPLTLTAGGTVEPADIDIVRGPLANIFVTGVSVGAVPDTMLEGAMASLVASTTTSDTMPPRVYWTVIDSLNLLTIDSTVTALLPGTGRVIASAGAFADTTSIVVRPAPAAVLLSPDTAFVVGIGGQATFSAVVVDPRGDTLPGEAVTWSSGAPSIVGSAGAGVFDALAPGTGAVRATSVTSPGVVGTAVIVVGAAPPAAVDVAVSKGVDVAQPLEDSLVTFTVSVVNNGPDTANSIVVYDTFPAAPFLSPAHSVSVGALDGDTLWTIPVLAPGDTATWTTAVTVATGVAGGSATNTALVRSLVQNDSTPANDTSFVTVTFPFSAPPVVQITAPTDGAVFDPGDLVSFIASASDAEDGDLTPSIQWSSNLDGALGTGRTVGTSTLTTGVHQIVASVTDSNTDMGADTITITIALITTPAVLNVPFAGTASLPITLSEPAQAGGITLAVASADESITVPSAATVSIPGAALSANATLSGLQPGVTTVTVSHPQFGASVTTVSVTAELNVLQSSLTVPETFPQPMTVRLESQGSPTAAPAGGLGVTLTSRNPSCAAVGSALTIPGGLVQASATVSAATGAQLPCQSWVVATSASITSDSVSVTVNPAPAITVNATTVGAGLQYGTFYASLATAQHGGVTVRVTSADPTRLLVAPNSTTPGTAFIDVAIPNGQSLAAYYVQGVEGTTGAPNLTASAPGFSDGTATISVVTPAYQVLSLIATRTAFAGEDVFAVGVGVPNGQQTAMSIFQNVRAGGTAIDVTVSSTVPSVGQLITLPDSVSPVSTQIVPGQYQTPPSVAAGGMALLPLAVGSTDVSASITGLVALPASMVTVTVSTPALNVNAQTVAGGLQYGTLYTSLAAAQHGGVTVTIASADPSLFLVSPDATTAGTASINVSVLNGQNLAAYYVQGLEGQTGVAQLRVTAPGFAADSAAYTVVAPAIDMVGLPASLTSFSPDDAFYIRTGVPNGQQTGLSIAQAVRAGGSALTATITSSDTGVGDLLTLPDSASPVTVQIPPGQFTSPSTVASGGAAFVPIGAGTTQVTARVPGYIPTTNADVNVTVTAPGINTSANWVGAGLQYGLLQATLGATDHPGVTVRVASADPSVLLVSADAVTQGSAFIDVPVATGQNAIRYYVHGVEGQSDTIPLRFSAPGFVSDSAMITVDTPAYDIVGLTASQTTFSPDDPFTVRVGRPLPGNNALWVNQAVRAGADTVPVTVTVSNTGVGLLKRTGFTGTPVTVGIPPGAFGTASTVASGGVAFDPLGIGTATVSSSIAGYIATTNASAGVTVSAPAITVPDRTVGAGLQFGVLYATLGSGGHGGVTVTLTSSNASVMQVSPDATTAGAASIQIVVPDGQTLVPYYVQGVEGADAIATLTLTAAGFTNGVGTVTVAPAALDIVGLGTTQVVGGPDDAFWVRIGVPATNNTFLAQNQAPRAGGTGFTATITSSAPSNGQLVTVDGTGGSVIVRILPGQFNSPTSVVTGGVAFDGLAAGTTTVTATIPGLITTSNGSALVTITP